MLHTFFVCLFFATTALTNRCRFPVTRSHIKTKRSAFFPESRMFLFNSPSDPLYESGSHLFLPSLFFKKKCSLRKRNLLQVLQDNEQCLHHGHRVSPKTKCLCLHLLFCLSPFSVSAQEKVQRFLFAKQLFEDGSSICTLLVNRDREDRETASTSVVEWSPPFPTYGKKEREEDEEKKKEQGRLQTYSLMKHYSPDG